VSVSQGVYRPKQRQPRDYKHGREDQKDGDGFFVSIQKVNHQTSRYRTHLLYSHALEQIKINELEVYFCGYSATPLASREIRVEKSKELNYYQGEVACNVQQMQAVKNIVNHTAYSSPYLVVGGSGTGKPQCSSNPSSKSRRSDHGLIPIQFNFCFQDGFFR
jgi:hypothetical protein